MPTITAGAQLFCCASNYSGWEQQAAVAVGKVSETVHTLTQQFIMADQPFL
jgi:hypothetical protein